MSNAIPSKRQFSRAQSRAARGLLNWSLDRTARAASVRLPRLQAYEAEVGDLTRDELIRLTAAYKTAGVMPKAASKAGEGVRLKVPRPYRMATGSRTSGVAGRAQPETRTPCALSKDEA